MFCNLTHALTSVCIYSEMEASRTPLSEAEFEEIMNRNRAISSSAISRAVSDASAGNTHQNVGVHTCNANKAPTESLLKRKATLCSL